MLQQIESIFENMAPMLKKLKKKTYEENMKDFRSRNNEIFFAMTDRMKAEDKVAEAKVISEEFIKAVKTKFEKNGKIRGNLQTDLNFFMIYYVFPSILLTYSDDAVLLADTLCEVWGKSFKDSKIGYTDYDTLYKSFKEKIFGIF